MVANLFPRLIVNINLFYHRVKLLKLSAVWTAAVSFNHYLIPVLVLLTHLVESLNKLYLLLLVLFLFFKDFFNLSVFWVELQLHFDNQIFILLYHMLPLRDLIIKFVNIGKCSLYLAHRFLQLWYLSWIFYFLLRFCSDQVISDFCAVLSFQLS